MSWLLVPYMKFVNRNCHKCSSCLAAAERGRTGGPLLWWYCDNPLTDEQLKEQSLTTTGEVKSD